MGNVYDLRSQLEWLENRGELVRIKKEVDPVFELSAVAKYFSGSSAVIFENVKGYDIPVVVGTDNSRARIAAALNTDNKGLIAKYFHAIQNPLPVVEVKTSPVKEVILTGEDVDLMKLPIPTHFEKDGGPYITSGIMVARDAFTGARNISYHRLMVRSKDEFGVLIQPRHLHAMYQKAEAAGKALEVAIAIGFDTAVRVAAATWGASIPYGLDELTIAGALRGKPVEVVKCETIDVWVPAHAEIVIEGEILPNVRKAEGPFLEFTGNYGDVWDNPAIKVKAITHRKNPIFQDLLTFTPEHALLLGLPYEPVLYERVKSIVPDTLAAHITPASCGKFHAVIQIKKVHEGDGKDTIIAGLASVRDIKLVTVVDDDVDPFNPADVEWAVSTRVQADRDVVIIKGAKGNELDPSCPRLAYTAKMGIDATKPLKRAERFERGIIPGADDIDISDYTSSF